MAYKDKDKQREATRERVRRYRQGVTKGVTSEGVTRHVIPKTRGQGMTELTMALPANFGEPDCECRHCRANRANGMRLIINHGQFKRMGQLADNEVNRVSLPGDPDYVSS